ncbi:GNAT family N-acetyltransferase [Bacillus sp. SM2101]|uniref:GNAT family N-acetyltransferase n=1 Tax=Bacillus sp. SM2101 TaxID=2805366 RepID=UPI001BDEC0E7|nr:GNAT family N-acetyltransferase [Bacillus sp. SM2101]
MAISLDPVLQEQKHVLKNLYSLYLHDLSKFTSCLNITSDGIFEMEELNIFWDTAGFSPFFIKQGEMTIGFVLLLERPFLKGQYDYCINDIFILNKYRGKGNGINVVKELFEQKKGKYYVIELVSNESAVSFWKGIYNKMNIKYENSRDLIDDEECFVQTFQV